MSHPLRENLEIHADELGDVVRCAKCHHIYCRADEDWQGFCAVRLFPPTKAGKLMEPLAGQYLLRQLYCPSCGALLDTDLVEEEKNESAGRSEQTGS